MSLPTHINRKQGYREEPNQPTNKAALNGQLVQSNKATPTPSRSSKATNPIVETNLKPEDFDILSIEMGEEIATIVVNKIVSLQSLKSRAIVGK